MNDALVYGECRYLWFDNNANNNSLVWDWANLAVKKTTVK